jgi:hypothetical protein
MVQEGNVIPAKELTDIRSPGGSTAIHRCHKKNEKIKCDGPPKYELFDKFYPHLLA